VQRVNPDIARADVAAAQVIDQVQLHADHLEKQQSTFAEYPRAMGRIAELQAEIDALKIENEVLVHRFNEATEKLEHWHKRLLEVHASSSWHITRPLRFISNLFRGNAIAIRPYVRSKTIEFLWRVYRFIASFPWTLRLVRWLFNRFPYLKERSLSFVNSGRTTALGISSSLGGEQSRIDPVATFLAGQSLSPRASVVYAELQSKLVDFAKSQGR
jgi:hypothetical protein